MVERDLREQMMHNMVVDDLMEEMVTDEPIVAVYGAEGTVYKGPFGGVVVRDIGVGMVEVGYCHCISSVSLSEGG